jgi:demethylmenaquinone methyltransferase/2-methoxy-6-polyprenyl-1,4-benzoquinol methylase
MTLPTKENKEKYVRDMFNSIAGRYDLMNTIMSVGMDRSWRKYAVNLTGIKVGGNALDICCGTGMFVLELVKTVGSQGKVTGLDFSEEMLAVAKERISSLKLNNVNLIQGNAMKLPFADNTFDSVTVGWGLRNVPDINQVAREMCRVVKPGGKVVSLDMAKPSAPVFKQIYWLYFEKLVPFLGKVWAGKEGPYAYLHDSAKAFPHQNKLAEIFAESGMINTVAHDLFGGVVAAVVGSKPE